METKNINSWTQNEFLLILTQDETKHAKTGEQKMKYESKSTEDLETHAIYFKHVRGTFQVLSLKTENYNTTRHFITSDEQEREVKSSWLG